MLAAEESLRAGQPILENAREEDSSDVILRFINSNEKSANERPNATCSVSELSEV